MVDRLRVRWKATSSGTRRARRAKRPGCTGWAALVGLLVGVAPSVGAASAPCTERLTVDWRFNAAAPIQEAPAVSHRGWVVVGSIDGYVHALDERGIFQWSYTLDSPAWGVTIGTDGRSYALSRSGILHVMLPSGRYQWGGRLPAGMLPTGLPAHSDRGVVYVPSELNLYAFSAGSGLMWRTFVGSTITSGPLVGSDGEAWVGTRSGRIMRIRSPRSHVEFTTPSRDEVMLVAADAEGVLVQAPQPDGRTALVAYDARGQERWRLDDVASVSSEGDVVHGGGAQRSQWLWLDPVTGKVLAERQLDLDDSAPPVRFGNQVVVPTNSGRIYWFGQEGAVEWCQVSTAPLLKARISRETGHVIATAGDGWIAAIRVRGPTRDARARLETRGARR